MTRSGNQGNRREEVYNSHLGSELTRLGGDFYAEERGSEGSPDCQGTWYGLNVVIECKYDIGTNARETLESQIKNRLRLGIANIGVEILYPSSFKSTRADPAEVLRSSELTVRLRTSDGVITNWIPILGVKGLVELFDLSKTFLSSNDALMLSVQELSEVVDRLSSAISRQPGHGVQIVQLVTAADPIGLANPSDNARQAAQRVAGLMIATALLMQHSLADFDSHVPKAPSGSDLRNRLVESWRVVVAHDYRSIFLTALQILETLGDSEASLDIELQHAVEVTRKIVKRQILGRQDLVGRIYHSLLSSQKYLATYYTRVSAAILLAGLATNPRLWEPSKFVLRDNEFDFRICDPAQGTGTLLSATLTEIRKYLLRKNDSKIDLNKISKDLIESQIWGFDILAYAVQVAATTLLLSAPGTVIEKSQLFQLGFGGEEGKLGSLEFLVDDSNETQGILFGALGLSVGVDSVPKIEAQSRDSDFTGEIAIQNILLPSDIDLVIMNPPFTRSGGSSRLLGSLDAEEHDFGRTRLQKLSNNLKGANVSAGLGALFVPLAHKMLRVDGRLAVILPKTMLTGSQWESTREFLAENYHLECVITSHDPTAWSFSDSTKLSECMFIARKLDSDSKRDGLQTVWVALTENPKTSIDANALVEFIAQSSPTQSGIPLRSGHVLGTEKGVIFLRDTPKNGEPWRYGQFSREELAATADRLIHSRAFGLNGHNDSKIPLTPLERCGSTGPDRRDLMDAFEVVSTITRFPTVHGNDSERVSTFLQTPNKYLRPRTEALKGRKLKDPNSMWSGAGRLLVAERLRLNSSRCIAVYTNQEVLSNVFHSVRLNEASAVHYKAQTVWLNSSLGVLAWIYLSSDTEGSWVSIKKFQLRNLPLLDFNQIGKEARSIMSQAFTSIGRRQVLNISRIERDPVRQFCDEAVSSAFGLSADELRVIRNLLGTEPKMFDGDVGVPDALHKEILDRAVELFGNQPLGEMN